MGTTAAVTYKVDNYTTQGSRLMGAQSAGEGFLKALVQHGHSPHLYGYTENRSAYDAFCAQVRPWTTSSHQLHLVESNNFTQLAEVGTLYHPNPVLGPLAWQRQYRYAHAYSLCGVTHTLAGKEIMTALGEFLTAPVQPWDALVCTSEAVKTMVDKLLLDWADYLTERVGARPPVRIQLPVIPLGVDCDHFLTGQAAWQANAQLREQWNIAPDDLVVLFVGRLSFHAKANPVPMYLALEAAAQSTAAKVHLVQAGWFGDASQEAEFRQGASLFCPSVNPILVDGKGERIRQQVWSVADVFVSLADNVQETFGLTPIEAMAAGLPVVVSDWNGYKETVRDGVDGFRIPTVMPPAGSGLDLAVDYQSERIGYNQYIGHTSLLSSVDVSSCAQAFTALFNQPELRKTMGESGRRRAREVYDWRVVIEAYEQLWAELAEIRTHAARQQETLPAPEISTYPLGDDPFRLLSHYPTQTLQLQDRLGVGSMASAKGLQVLRSLKIANFGASKRSPAVVMNQVVSAVDQSGALTVAEILDRYAGRQERERVVLVRSLVYLMKFDVLRRLL